jgi:excinuclease ABC subunit C
MVFADQAELFPVLRSAGCLRYEIGTCLGPCAGATARPAYMERVRAARAFLANQDTTPLETLERDMKAASAALEFERAAALRDKRDVLQWLRDQLDRLHQAREKFSFVYPVAGADGKKLWYLIHGGRTVAVLVPPSDADREQAAAVLETVYQGRPAASDAVAPDDMDHVFLVTSWFRRHPEERRRTLTPAAALALCHLPD